MSRHKHSRPATLAMASLAALSLAAPAMADTVGVTITSADGTRQFEVQDPATSTKLTNIELGTGGEKAFKPVVKDVNKKVVSRGYQVTAEMTNLYLRTSDGGTPTNPADDVFDYNTKIPSSDVSVRYDANPLGVSGLSLPVVPSFDLTGQLTNCSDPTTALGLGLTGAITSLTELVGNPLLPLCTTLSLLAPATATLTAGEAVVQGLPQTISSGIALADLPFALTGAAETGAFSNASYATGSVGASDSAGKNADAAAGKATTTKRIMSGTPAFTAGLQNTIQTALNTALNMTPLTADGATSRATLDAVYAALNVDPALTTLTSQLAALPTEDEIEYLNRLTSTLRPLTQAALSSITADYFALPVLRSTPTTAVAGTYGGTLVVTFLDGV